MSIRIEEKRAADPERGETSPPPLIDHDVVKQSNSPLMRNFNDAFLELLRLLREAAEVEHAMMLQFLYGSFSIKDKYSEMRGDGSISESKTLLGVAIQEMEHLHKVNLLLTRLGAPPNLHRQDFPVEPDIYPFEMNLCRLSLKSLAKYVYAEASATSIDLQQGIKPEDEAFMERLYGALDKGSLPNHLGSLYGAIIDLMCEVSRTPPPFIKLEKAEWDKWIAALEDVKQNGTQDHFIFFRELLMGRHKSFPDPAKQDVWILAPEHEDYPSLNVPENPSAYNNQKNKIQDPKLRALSWLGDLHYWITLGLLDMSYRYDDWSVWDDTSPRHHMALAKRHMRGPIIQIGVHLAEQGAGLPFDVLSMGYSFGRSKPDAQRMLSRIVVEARNISDELGQAGLPNGFKTSIYPITLSGLADGV